MSTRGLRGALLACLAFPVAVVAQEPPESIRRSFSAPERFRDDLGDYKSPLEFADGRTARTAAEWADRRREIRNAWHDAMGAWPPLIERPTIEDLGDRVHRENFTQRKLRLKVAPDRTVEGYLIVPEGKGPFPAMLIVYYEPETAIGKGQPDRDFAVGLAKRGIASLAIGFDPRVIDTDKSEIKLQPLSYLAYVAANAYNAMATIPELDAKRIGVMGHSYGGKWAMFAACLNDNFACGAWSDPGVAFDEARPNVNYWDPWYLGWEPGHKRKAGPITPENPRTGAYKTLVAAGHDLHELQSLMAPRPFFVSGGSEDTVDRWKALNHAVSVNRLLGNANGVAMTNRPDHTPTEASNAQMYDFLVYALKPIVANGDRR